MKRSAIVTLALVVAMILGLLIAGPWLWKGLLRLHGVH